MIPTTCSGTVRASGPDRGERPVALGIDIGGTKVAARAEGGPDTSEREEVFRWPVDSTATEDLDLLARHVRPLLERAEPPVAAVGIALPASCDPDGVVVSWPSRPGWIGFDLGAALRSIAGPIPVTWADDGDLAAVAEARAAGRDDVLYLGVGTGVGGGMVLDGRSWPGPGRGTCETGHLVVQLGGPPCACGRRGCAQAIASGPATLRRAGDRLGRAVSFDELAREVGDGRPWAVDVLRASAAALAAVVVGVCELVAVQLVVVGGGFATSLPRLVDLVAEEVAAAQRPGAPAPPVRAAVLGGLSSLHGAVLAARDVVGHG